LGGTKKTETLNDGQASRSKKPDLRCKKKGKGRPSAYNPSNGQRGQANTGEKVTRCSNQKETQKRICAQNGAGKSGQGEQTLEGDSVNINNKKKKKKPKLTKVAGNRAHTAGAHRLTGKLTRSSSET